MSEQFGIPIDAGKGVVNLDQSFGSGVGYAPAQYVPQAKPFKTGPGVSPEVKAILDARKRRMAQLSGLSSGLNFGSRPTVYIGDETNNLFRTQNMPSLLGS
jgi:hypothetical protein